MAASPSVDITSDSPSGLTGALAEIAGIVGLEAALKLARVAGGIRIYVPVGVDDRHWISEAIGRTLAEKLCAEFRGNFLFVPLGPCGPIASEVRRRREAIGKMIKAGLSSAEIARRAGVTQRTVHSHRAKLRNAK